MPLGKLSQGSEWLDLLAATTTAQPAAELTQQQLAAAAAMDAAAADGLPLLPTGAALPTTSISALDIGPFGEQVDYDNDLWSSDLYDADFDYDSLLETDDGEDYTYEDLLSPEILADEAWTQDQPEVADRFAMPYNSDNFLWYGSSEDGQEDDQEDLYNYYYSAPGSLYDDYDYGYYTEDFSSGSVGAAGAAIIAAEERRMVSEPDETLLEEPSPREVARLILDLTPEATPDPTPEYATLDYIPDPILEELAFQRAAATAEAAAASALARDAPWAGPADVAEAAADAAGAGILPGVAAAGEYTAAEANAAAGVGALDSAVSQKLAIEAGEARARRMLWGRFAIKQIPLTSGNRLIPFLLPHQVDFAVITSPCIVF